jgi:hypothetical protein
MPIALPSVTAGGVARLTRVPGLAAWRLTGDGVGLAVDAGAEVPLVGRLRRRRWRRDMDVLPNTAARLASFKLIWADDEVKHKLDTVGAMYNAPR